MTSSIRRIEVRSATANGGSKDCATSSRGPSSDWLSKSCFRTTPTTWSNVPRHTRSCAEGHSRIVLIVAASGPSMFIQTTSGRGVMIRADWAISEIQYVLDHLTLGSVNKSGLFALD
jgi:hypothetical protein